MSNSSTGKFVVVTASATPFSYGGHLAITQSVYSSTTQNIVCLNSIGDSITVPFFEGQTIEIETNAITTAGANTCLAIFK